MEELMVLSGDGNVPAMPMTEAEVNHLRRQLRRAEDWIADALKDYERAILRAAGVLVKD